MKEGSGVRWVGGKGALPEATSMAHRTPASGLPQRDAEVQALDLVARTRNHEDASWLARRWCPRDGGGRREETCS
jgi:hypothetical protein